MYSRRQSLSQIAAAVTGAFAALALQAAPAFAQDKIKVVTSFTIIADMAQNVAGEAADVVSITKPGAEIHGYQPTPRDLVRAQGADLILWNGLNLERWFEQFFGNLRDVPAVVVSDGIVPMAIAGGEYDGKPNPHGWMALSSAVIYVDNIRDALSAADPANAQTYAANAARYKDEIAQVIAPLVEEAKALPDNRRWLVTSEGAFSYLARDFGLSEVYLWPINADAQGTPQQVKAVIDAVRENDIPAVFSESTVSDKPAKQVVRETGARYGGVLYVDSLSAQDGPVPTYLDLLRVTSETIVKGLQE
jgi:manganese/iron transport system substrate-binding protein